jgi:hypothetical protein
MNSAVCRLEFDPMVSPKEECEDLMNGVVRFAAEMLCKHREFFPFGGTMSPSGQMAFAHAWDGKDEQPPSVELIELLDGVFPVFFFERRGAPPRKLVRHARRASNLRALNFYWTVMR